MSAKAPLYDRKFILASASERRRQLLSEAGYRFDVVPADIDEQKFLREGIEPAEFARRAALAKANKIAAENPGWLVLGADTVVDFEGQIIGKARDETHAEEITEKLFSKPHKVITGVAIVRKPDNLEIVDSDTTVI